MTDFRALCAELADSLEDWLSSNSIGGISLDDGTDAELIFRARAALAQPELQGPTDDELKAVYWEAFKNAAPCGADQSWLEGLRAVAHWDHPVIELDGPAVLSSREPASIADQSTDKELWELYDEMGGDPEDSAWCLNYARAVLDRWGS